MASVPETAMYDPATRDTVYGGNYAKYLVDLHDARATFDFCGGMFFQLSLSPRLRERLSAVARDKNKQSQQPVVYDARVSRMSQMPGYERSSNADNCRVFHGREVRKVQGAEGGFGFVLHLSDAEEGDAEGWSEAERRDYDGWGHDSNRNWRKLAIWQKEGVSGFREKFGPDCFGLHHRFYLHKDRANNIWLSAEDGCEGVVKKAPPRF